MRGNQLHTTIKIWSLLGLFLGGIGGEAIAKTPAKPKERIAKSKQAEEPAAQTKSTDQLITFETIAARSGDLLKPYLSKPTPLQDTLHKAMESTYKANPSILSQRAAVRSADEGLVQAKAGWRPSVTARLSNGYQNNKRSGDSIDRARSNFSGATERSEGHLQSAQLEVTQNLFNGGSTVAQTEGAQASIQSQRAALIEAEQNTLLNAVQVYLELITQLAQLEVLRANEGFLKVTLRSTKDKFDVGEETRTSVAQAEAQYAESIAKRQAAEAQLHTKIATYEQVVGRSPGKLGKPTVPKSLPKTLKEALNKARLNNPSILKAQYEEIAARRRVDQVNGGLLPKVDLQGSSSLNQQRSRDVTVSAAGPGKTVGTDFTADHRVTVNVSIPIYEAGSVRSQKRQAIEEAEKNRIQIEVVRRQIEQQLIQAYREFEASKSNIKFYAEQVKANEISVEGTKQEVLVGSKILLDVLNAQNRLLEAQQTLVQAEQNYYLAAYKIVMLMGLLTAKSLQLQVEHYDPTGHYNTVKNAF